MASASTRRAVGQKSLPQGFVAVPSTLTELTAVDTWIFQIVVSNTTGAPVTFLVQDQQGTPRKLVPTISLGANSVTVLDFPEGVLMKSGVKWQAGAATSLDAEVFGMRRD